MFTDFSVDYRNKGGQCLITKGLEPETSREASGEYFSMLMGELLCRAEQLAPPEAAHLEVYGYFTRKVSCGRLVIESWRNSSGKWEGRDYEMYREYWE